MGFFIIYYWIANFFFVLTRNWLLQRIRLTLCTTENHRLAYSWAAGEEKKCLENVCLFSNTLFENFKVNAAVREAKNLNCELTKLSSNPSGHYVDKCRKFPHPTTDLSRSQSTWSYCRYSVTRLGPSEGYSRTSFNVLQNRNEFRGKLKLY